MTRRAKRWGSLLILGAVLLGGCAREVDAFRPRVIITEPEASTISRQTSAVVRGYAMDDTGVRQILVNGQPLKLREGSRKIVPFAFKTAVAGQSANYTIEAIDDSGQRTRVELPLRYDPVPPKLEITKFEREGKTMRVTGIATDNTKVVSVTVDGGKLGVSAGRRVPFYAEATGVYVDIVVTDAAGNKQSKRVQ